MRHQAAPQWAQPDGSVGPVAPGGERFFQSLLDNLPVAAAVSDENGEIVAVNRTWSELTPTPMLLNTPCGIGDNLLEDTRTQDWAELRDALRSVLAGEASQQRVLVERDGIRFGQLRVVPQTLNEERGALLTWVDWDVAGVDHQALASAVLANTADYLFVVDRAGKLRYINRPFGAYSPEECLGQPADKFLGTQSYTEAKHALSSVLDGSVEEAAYENHHADGRVYESRVTPLKRREVVIGAVVNTSDVTARFQAQTQATKLKEQYESLFHSMPVMLSAVDGEGRITAVNGHWLKKLGYRKDEVLGRLGREFLTPEWQQEIGRGIFQTQNIADHSEDIPLQMIRKDGQTLDVLATSGVERDRLGKVTGVRMRMIDITERNRAQAALRQSEARFQRAVRGTSDGLWDWDLESGLVWYAPRFKELLGFAPDEFADNFVTFREALHPDDRGGTLAAISQHLDGNTALDLECRLRAKTGTYKWFRLRGLAYQGDDGTPRRMAGSIQDITVQKHADQALRDNRNFYELILDSVPEHIAYVDAKLRVKFMNRSCAELFEVSSNKAVGARFDELMKPALYAQMSAAIDAVFDSRQVRTEMRLPKEVGEVVLDIEMLAHRGQQERVLGFFWVGRDMTRHNQLEAELRQAQKMEAVGQLTGGIAHDFNNLLSVVLGNLQLLERRLADTPGMLTKVQTAKRAAVRGGELTKRLLAFARQQVLAPEIVELNQLVGGMVELLRRSLGDAVQIDLRLEAASCIEVDPGQAENALLNLAINARDAMQDGGQLTIHTKDVVLDADFTEPHQGLEPGDFVLLSVTDTGTGIPEELIAQVFEPFFTTKEVGKGSGLGLSMVVGFVNQSGGHVAIASELGRGTSIQLYFPKSTGQTGASAADCSLQDDGLPTGNETVLVVEDDADVRTTAVDMLGELGYRIVEADSASRALDILGSGEPIDLLFTDIMMPGMRGTQLAQRARQNHPNLRVVYASGFTATGVLDREALKSGAELLGKPYTAEDLAATVREVLDQEIE